MFKKNEENITKFNLKSKILQIDKKTQIWILASIFATAMMICSAYMQVAFPLQARLFANIFFVCLYFLLFSFVWMCIRNPIKNSSFTAKQWLVSALGCAVILASVGIFLYIFLAQEKTIKVWDSRLYWSKLIQEIGNFYNNIPDAITRLLSSFASEYSNLAAVPLIPFGVYLGMAFERYAFFIFAVYFVPACLLLSFYVIRVYSKISGNLAKPWHMIVATAICAFSIPFFFPVILGRLDVAGVVIVMLMAHFTLDWKWEEFSLKNNLILAVLSLALLLTRRWFAFYIVGFYFAFGVEYVWQCFERKKFDGKRLIQLMKNLVFIAGICIAFLVIFTPDTLKLFLANNYSKEYSAYKFRTDFGDIIDIAKDFGFILIAFSILGYVAMIIKKATRQFAIRWLVAVTVAFVLFERIQSAGVHHRYLFIPTVLLGICFAVIFMGEHFKNIKGGAVVCGITAFCICNTAIAFVPTFKTWEVGRGIAFSQVQSYPEIRNDIEQIKNIVNYINTCTGENFDKAYAIGDSDLFSQEVLKCALLPTLVDATPNIIPGSIIDLRDGFPSQAFLAQYFLTVDSLDNVSLGGTKVISELYDLIMKNPATKEFYSVSYSEEADDITWKVLQKTKPLTKSFVDELRTALLKAYPNEPFVYEPNYFWALANIDTDVTFEYYQWLNGIYLVPTNNTKMNWQLLGQFTTLQFETVNWNENLSYQVNIDGKLSSPVILKPDAQTITIDVSNAQNIEITFNSDIAKPSIITMLKASLI